MDLGAMQNELAARGFDYLVQNVTRANQYLNDAYLADICEDADWPFLEATETGTAPLEISDLANIESVIDSTAAVKLRPLDRRNITDDWDTDLTTAGSPEFYYQTTSTTVNVYPANTTDTLSVRYWKVPTALADSTDEPLIPNRFHSLIVDAAVARAYEDDDEWEAATAAWDRFQVRLNRMRESLLIGQHDEPDDLIAAYAPDTDL